jgi:hypothetical protein
VPLKKTVSRPRSRSEELYPQVKEVVEALGQSVPIPEALVNLAALPFKLFVTTNFDNLLLGHRAAPTTATYIL